MSYGIEPNEEEIKQSEEMYKAMMEEDNEPFAATCIDEDCKEKINDFFKGGKNIAKNQKSLY